jgi:tetratricopeptide (TPR) repeat protein
LNSSPSTLAKPIRSNGDHRAREFNDKSLASAKNSDWTQAIRLASAAIDIDPGYAPAYVNRCWAYMAKGYNSEAAADCNIALSIDPNNTEAINNRGAIRQAEGDLKSALADFDYACKASLDIACTNFEKIEGYSPKDVSSFVNKQLMHSLMKFQEKDWGAVIAITTKILEIAPKTIDALATRSGAFANKGLLDEALSDAQSAVRLNPEYALSYNNRGYVYQLMGKPRLAAIDYEISCGLKFDLGCINFDKLQKQIQ